MEQSMIRTILIIIGIALVLLLIAVIAIPALVDVNRFRPQIEAKLEEELGRKVSLGEMRLGLFPLRFRVNNAVIEENPEFSTGRPFAQAQTLYVQPKLLPLIHKDLQIGTLELVRPNLEFVRSRNGAWNFGNLATGQKQSGKPVTIDRLKIDDGQVAITDLQQNEPRTVYDHIDLALWDFAPGKPFSLRGNLHVQGSGNQTIAFDGKAGPIRSDGLARTPIDGKFQFNEVSVSGLQRTLNIQALENSDAVITGTANINNNDGMLNSAGRLDARAPRVRGVDIGYPVRIDYDIQGNLNQNSFDIRKADVRLGQTPIDVTGRVDAHSRPAVFDLNLKTSQASLAEAARLAAAFGVAFNPSVRTDGVLNLNVHARGTAKEPVMDGHAGLRDVRISGGDLKEPVNADAMEFSLSPTAIQSNEFTARTGRTNVRAQFTINDYATAAPQLKASVSTVNAEIGELLRIARAYGMSAVDGIRGSGTAQINLALTGPMKQTEQMIYTGNGALQNATFELPSLNKPLAVRTAAIRFTANSVVMDNLDFSLGETVARGNMTIHNPAAPRVEFSLAANKINVPEWQALARTSRAEAQPQQQQSPSQPGAEARNNLLRRMSGSGNLAADTVVYDQLVLNNVHATVRLDRGVITVDPINAGLYGGQQVGSVVIDARNEPPTYTVNSRLQSVDANRLLTSISPIKNSIFGMLGANANTRFTGTGDATNIARTMQGRISINLHDASITNMDVLHQVASIAQFLQLNKPMEPATKVAQLNGDFDVNNGVARTNNLKATTEFGSVAATGSVDLGQQTLNLHATAVLSRDYSDLVGGTAIGGFMTTAVANQNGELVVPVIVTGTFQHPQFAPDLQKVAEMKLRQLVPTTNNPADLSIGILGQIFGRQKTQPSREPQEQQQPNNEQREGQQQPQPQPQPQPPEPQTLPNILDQIFKNLPQGQTLEQPRR
jgi:AsmA protein